MAKKGKKGKKGKGKGKKEVVVTDQLTEVERELFQIQIADLTAKVERLKARCLELETSHEELQKNYETMDEDRGDIIAYLKRVTQQKSEEIEELEERIDGLIKERESAVDMYSKRIAQLEHEYKVMHENLTAEIKLLTGKLNSLEEFRVQRDDLTKRFKNQEEQMREQEEVHKTMLYEVERKFIIGKDKLKKEMETRLLQLSTDFQDATEIRIAATTHHTIRENIAINNELDLMLETHDRLYTENEQMKEENRQMRLKMELFQKERNVVMSKNMVQKKLLEKLSIHQEDMRVQVGKLEYAEKRLPVVQAQLEQSQNTLSTAFCNIRFLEHKLHAALTEQQKLQRRTAEARLKSEKLMAVIDACVLAIQEALQVQTRPSIDAAYDKSRREGLLVRLLELMDTSTIQYITVPLPSAETVVLYEPGDLGFIPKSKETLWNFESMQRLGDSLQADSLERLIYERSKEMGGESPGSLHTVTSLATDQSPDVIGEQMEAETSGASITQDANKDETELPVEEESSQSET